jgi:HK97 family phage prohead protease
VKDVGESDGTFEGYGSVFGVLDSYADIVAKGAFKRTLREAKAAADAGAALAARPVAPIGVYTDMREDDTGLYVKGQLLDTSLGSDAYKLLKAGALSGLSIGFRP